MISRAPFLLVVVCSFGWAVGPIDIRNFATPDPVEISLEHPVSLFVRQGPGRIVIHPGETARPVLKIEVGGVYLPLDSGEKIGQVSIEQTPGTVSVEVKKVAGVGSQVAYALFLEVPANHLKDLIVYAGRGDIRVSGFNEEPPNHQRFILLQSPRGEVRAQALSASAGLFLGYSPQESKEVMCRTADLTPSTKVYSYVANPGRAGCRNFLIRQGWPDAIAPEVVERLKQLKLSFADAT